MFTFQNIKGLYFKNTFVTVPGIERAMSQYKSNHHRPRYAKKNKVNLHLPNRWRDYTTIGKVVPGTRFIPFKTPLKEEICRRSLVSEKEWFTPAMLLEKAPNIKLIIDLTQTDRFYNGKFFKEHGVLHQKIICPGGGRQLPPSDILARFTSAIKQFLESKEGLDKDTLIGVHCTHGLNRTGYLICNYMINHEGATPQDAIEAFEEARGHKIERDLYKSDLLRTSTLLNSTSSNIATPSQNYNYGHKNRYVPDNSNWRDECRSRTVDQYKSQLSCVGSPDIPRYNSNSISSSTDNPGYNWRSQSRPRTYEDYKYDRNRGYNYTTSNYRNGELRETNFSSFSNKYSRRQHH